MKVGFIGLGIMGKPMAKKLIENGYNLLINDVNKDNENELIPLSAISASYKDIASNCKYIILSLPNGEISKNVVDEMYEDLKRGTVICDTSSITPSETIAINSKLQKIGVGYIDAPVSGGEEKAITGELSLMAGGDEEDFINISEILDAFSQSKILVGESGSGSATKLINQVIVNMNIATLSESFVLAKKLNLDPNKMYLAIKDGLAGSNVLDAKIDRMVNNDFEPGGKISINFKDINNVMETAKNYNCPMIFTSTLQQILRSLMINGCENDDHAAIVKFFESMGNIGE